MAAAAVLAPSSSAFYVISSYALLLIFAFFVTSVRSEGDFSVLRLPSQPDSSMTGIILRDVIPEPRACAATTKPMSCPVKCFRPDPVCGVDGVIYWCGCADARCAGIEVAKLGFCDMGSVGSASFSGQALLLVHIVWLIVLGVLVLFGFF